MSAPEPHWADEDVTLFLGDCLTVLPDLPECSVDAVVCDPPYDLTGGKKGGSGPASLNEKHPAGRSRITTGGGFMGKEWDATGVAFDPATWQAVMRVMKPGAYLLAFGGSRTWHRMVCAIEDAGFEIRDPIADLTGMDAPGLLWIQGQGYPKNLDVSKAIDRRGGAPQLAAEIGAAIKAAREARAWSIGRADKHFCGGSTNWSWYEGRKGICRPPVPADFARIAAEWPELAEWAEAIDEVEREVIANRSGTTKTFNVGADKVVGDRPPITAAATEAARRWEGWGTALKPAWEPIAVARKPLKGTVAQNVLEYGTGAFNLAGCRVATEDDLGRTRNTALGLMNDDDWQPQRQESESHEAGRWPPNLVIGETAAAELDRQSGVLTSGANPARRGSDKFRDAYGDFAGQEQCVVRRGADSGGASRFFPVFKYEAKAGASERPRLADGTAWSTVKPVDLMRWLVRLVTPPGGTVLDPFMGTAATGEACIVEGFPCILIDRDPVAVQLALERLRKPIQPTLFGEAS